MKRLTKKILARDAERVVGAEILQAVREIKAGKTGRRFLIGTAREVKTRLEQEVAHGGCTLSFGEPLRDAKDDELVRIRVR